MSDRTSLERGNSAFRSHQFDDAVNFYEKALKEVPEELKEAVQFNLTLSKVRLAGVQGGARSRGDSSEKLEVQSFASAHVAQELPSYVPRLGGEVPPVKTVARVIAFYLPQFHPIPENDAWWGEGFTEWTNVRPAKPLFDGHYQPHEPDDFLGYYDLRDTAVMRRQIELAKQYGVEGFCFYAYWFSGKRLLETPLDNYLADPALDLPFCVCWANENWSRRWDGRDQDVLIAQHYSDADDIAFISHMAKYLRDPRYIQVDGKPLLIVYRPNLFPSMRATAARWRAWCKSNGLGDIHIAYVQSFEKSDPAKYGLDSAIEFPPNNSAPPNVSGRVFPGKDAQKRAGFEGNVFDWSILPQRSEAYEAPAYTLYRGACPSWDNTARKKLRATAFVNSGPALFKRWLVNAFRDSMARFEREDSRLVFINAWNEWAEGAHLEPDRRYGYAWLDAVRQAHVEAGSAAAAVPKHVKLPQPDIVQRFASGVRAGLRRVKPRTFMYAKLHEARRFARKAVALLNFADSGNGEHSPRSAYRPSVRDLRAKPLPPISRSGTDILFVSHDAHSGGAQLSLLSIVRFFAASTSLRIRVLLLGGGVHVPSFEAVCPVLMINRGDVDAMSAEECRKALEVFCGGSPALLYCNTIATGPLLKSVGAGDYKIISHIRELRSSIHRYGGDAVPDVVRHTDLFLTCSRAVADYLVSELGVPADKTEVSYPSMERSRIRQAESEVRSAAYRREISKDPGVRLVLGCGIGMPFRKGADLFIDMFRNFENRSGQRVHFRWIGAFQDSEANDDGVVWADCLKRVHERQDPLVTFDIIPFQKNVLHHFAQGDVYLMTSREEPLGRTALEAIAAGVTVLGFKGAGGIEEVLECVPENLIENFSAKGMAARLECLLESPAELGAGLAKLKRQLEQKFTAERNFPRIVSAVHRQLGTKPAVSIIVPNFNYARYLDERIRSILDQTFQDFELIILDDASTDGSREVIERYASDDDRITTFYNDQNSGSPYPQWFRGIEMAQSDLVWVAEADDLCEPTFLEDLLPYFSHPDVRLAYCASQSIDAEGRVGSDYRRQAYLSDLSRNRWDESYLTDADEEVCAGLGVKNTVLNISSAVFRKFDLSSAAKERIGSMVMAGDWLFLLECIRGGSLAFHSKVLNSHRRHAASAIHRELKSEYLEKLFRTRAMVHNHVRENFEVSDEFEKNVDEYVTALAKEHAGAAWLDALSIYRSDSIR